MDRRRLTATAIDVASTAAVVAGAVNPAAFGPLIGLGLGVMLARHHSRRACLGAIWGLAGVAAFLPLPTTTAQRVAIASLCAWSLCTAIGWRAAIVGRRVAEAAVDTIMIVATARLNGDHAPREQLIRTLTDIVGGTGGAFTRNDGLAPASAAWRRRRRDVLVPIAVDGVSGVVTISGVASRPAAWQLELADTVTARFTPTLVDARAVPALEADAIDPVTGLGNGRAVVSTLSTLAHGDVLVVVDLDGLEAVRSEEGDARADLLLCQLALHLRNRLRASDLVARYGDERFLVVLRNPQDATDVIFHRLLSDWPAEKAGCVLLASWAAYDSSCSALDALDVAVGPLDMTAKLPAAADPAAALERGCAVR